MLTGAIDQEGASSNAGEDIHFGSECRAFGSERVNFQSRQAEMGVKATSIKDTKPGW